MKDTFKLVYSITKKILIRLRSIGATPLIYRQTYRVVAKDKVFGHAIHVSVVPKVLKGESQHGDRVALGLLT